VKRQTTILAAIAGGNILLGFLSSWYVMTRLGTGHATDALFAGSTIPGLVLNIVSASLTSVLVPILARTDRDALRQEAWNFLIVIGMAFGAAAALLVLTAPVWVPWTVPGFDGSTRQLTVRLTQIQLLGMVFTALSSVLWSVCYAKETFIWTELSGLLGTVIGFGMLLFALPHIGVAAAAWMVVIENALQTALLLPLIGRPRRPDLKSVALVTAWRQMRPLMLGTSYYKTDQLVDRLLASMTPAGSLSLLNLGQTIYAAGHQMISRTLVSTVIPRLSRDAHDKDWGAFSALTFGRLTTITALTGCVVLAMVSLGGPALTLLFGHGRIGPHDIHRLWLILLAMAGFWIAGGGGFVTTAAFYARGETTVPAKVSAWTYSLYIPVKIYAAWHYGILGIAASISLFHVLNTLAQAILTSRFLRRANADAQKNQNKDVPVPIGVEPLRRLR
jgi:putative peptidoglycan lipid II flippase